MTTLNGMHIVATNLMKQIKTDESLINALNELSCSRNALYAQQLQMRRSFWDTPSQSNANVSAPARRATCADVFGCAYRGAVTMETIDFLFQENMCHTNMLHSVDDLNRFESI